MCAAVLSEPEAPEAELWLRWRTAADASAREALLDLHLPYARVVAATYFARRVNNDVEFADYLQLATLGLIESVDRFDPSFGVQFRTFAARRMHGALLDGIEHMTEKRQQIAATHRIEQQYHAITQGEAAADSTVRSVPRLPEQVLQYVAEAGIAFALSWLLEGTAMLRDADPGEAVPFYRDVELRQLRERIVDLVRNLPPQEGKVLHAHYFQAQRFDHIADMMQLSKGRISQIHKRALQRLRELLQDQRNFDVSW